MSNRKLASIMTVKSIAYIEGKDRIGYVSFNETGWEVIGSKSLKPGDKVLYLEYDSIIPEKTLNMLEGQTETNLRKRCWSLKHNGCLIRAMKMSGKISYGILFEFKEIRRLFAVGEWEKLPPGTDLTEKLGIIKKDDEDSAAITAKEKPNFFQKWYSIILWKLFKIKKKKSGLGQWVPFVGRTDETRINALSNEVFEWWKDKMVYVTEKLDGQSYLFAIFKGKVYICSRNQCLYIKPLKQAMKELVPENASKQTDRFIATACRYDLASSLNIVRNEWFGGDDIALNGEQVGEGIQKNPLQIPGTQLFIFNVFNIKDQRYFSREKILKVIELLYENSKPNSSQIRSVPVLLSDTKFQWNSVRELEELAKGPTFNGRGKYREGVVIRVDTATYMPEHPKGCANMASFKVLNSDYLLKTMTEE